jgi:hypothetical protein
VSGVVGALVELLYDEVQSGRNRGGTLHTTRYRKWRVTCPRCKYSHTSATGGPSLLGLIQHKCEDYPFQPEENPTMTTANHLLNPEHMSEEFMCGTDEDLSKAIEILRGGPIRPCFSVSQDYPGPVLLTTENGAKMLKEVTSAIGITIFEVVAE